jgi:ABC-type uncharacterized transport system YnjBCD substrate-binding protein
MIVPNEVRVSTKSNFNFIVRSVISLFRDQGYTNCKVVGRGMATELTREVFDYLMKAHPYLIYESSVAKSLNKMGRPVEEFHILISQKSQKTEPTYNGQRYGYGAQPQRNSQFEANSTVYH